MGTLLEEMARKDFYYLRDANTKANSVDEVSSIVNIRDPIQRSKLIVTLALLNSANQECAKKIYELFKIDILNLSILNDKNEIDDKIADEYLLLLTMAANHPAFEFAMKTTISTQLKLFETKLNYDKIEPHERQEQSTSNNNNTNSQKNDIENDYNSSCDITLTPAPLTMKSANLESFHSVEGSNSGIFVLKVLNANYLTPPSLFYFD
jgi:hypothetical protein